MTRAVLFEDAAGRITGVSVKGHSGYAEEGSDIVCAGISTLLITIDQALCSLVGLSPIEHGGEDGFAEVLLPPGISGKQMEQAQLLCSLCEETGVAPEEALTHKNVEKIKINPFFW